MSRFEAGDLQRPQVVVDADAGRELKLAERRISDPARLRELTDHQRNVDQQDARCGQAERHRVQRRKSHVAHAKLQRDDEIHQADHERHRHEEDHDGAVRREDLVEMLRRQIALRTAGRDRLLRSHHDRIGEAAQQHEHRQNDVHDADALVVDRGDPLAPEIRHVSFQRDPAKDGYYAQDHAARGTHDDRLVEWNCVPAELAEEIHCSALCDFGWVSCDGSAGCIPALEMPLKRSGATAR